MHIPCAVNHVFQLKIVIFVPIRNDVVIINKIFINLLIDSFPDAIEMSFMYDAIKELIKISLYYRRLINKLTDWLHFKNLIKLAALFDQFLP